MTLLGNVISSAFLRTANMAEARREAQRWLEFCNLTPYAGQLARGLPIGSRKRLEITRALGPPRAHHVSTRRDGRRL